LANYFLDTSALAKLYHKEIGSEHLDRILDERGSGSIIYPASRASARLFRAEARNAARKGCPTGG